MKPKALVIWILVLLCGDAGLAADHPQGKVDSFAFKTTVPLPYCKPTTTISGMAYGAFLASLETLPESAVVLVGLRMAGAMSEVTKQQEAALQGKLTTVYARIERDPAFAGTTSALPHCFSTQTRRPGHYFLYRPNTVGKGTRTIVFLHGDGGNFLFYTWALKEAFPRSIILAPSHGLSWIA